MGSFDDAFISETEYHQRVLMLNQIEGLMGFVYEIKFEGMELLEHQEEDELGSIDSEDDDCFGGDDSLELNIKRAPDKYRNRNKKSTESRCSTGKYQNGAVVVLDLKNDQTKSNDGAVKLSGGSSSLPLHGNVKQRRFSSCAA
jgi:hypothetical protein